jgi:alcohol dehydrogenase class IV
VLHGLAEDTEFYNQLYSFIKGIGGDVSLNKIVSKDVLVNKLNDIVELTIQDPDVIYNPVTPDVEAIEQLVMKMFDGEL